MIANWDQAMQQLKGGPGTLPDLLLAIEHIRQAEAHLVLAKPFLPKDSEEMKALTVALEALYTLVQR